MAYGLPANGELNWDVKLNASIEAVKATADSGKATADAAIPATEKGAASGVATLGADGKVPAAQLAVEGTASSTTFTPAGNIAATNVQAAIQELDTEKETPAGAQAKVDTHVAAADPHGDRAYVDGLLAYKGARAYLATTAQSIPNSTFTAISFNAEDHDTGGWHDNAVNPTRMTIPAGVTKVDAKAQVGFLSNATGMRQVEIRKNGTTVATNNSNAVSGYSTYVSADVPGLVVAPGDYLEVHVWQNSGAALSIQESTGGLTWFLVRATR